MEADEPGVDEVGGWRRRAARQIPDGFRSPRVQRLIATRGLDDEEVATIPGTGLDGRLSAADVLRREPTTQRIPFNRIRARAAVGLLDSKRSAAHAFTSIACDYSAVEAARLPARERWRAAEGFALTYLPFVARAVISALRTHPEVNATVAGGDPQDPHADPTSLVGAALVVHRDVNLGIAVDLDHEGLVVPVVRDAGTLSLVGLARAISDVARRARAKRLSPDDLVGGTFTITNPGAHGTYVSVPIINQPQAAIVSTDGVRKTVVAQIGSRGEPVLTIRPMGNLCCSFDHRALDGAYVGSFLDRVREVLETRDWTAEVG